MGNTEPKGISDLAGISQPVVKLFDIVQWGIGRIFEPTHTVKMAKAKAKEMQIVSDAMRQNIDLPAKYEDGKLTIDTSNAQALMNRTAQRLGYQEMQKQQNIESVIGIAYTELEKENTVSEEPVDNDWILRFFNSVEDISNEEMQKIWGRVLAGEIKNPRSFSFRTLNVLRNLSQTEAQAFQTLAQFIIFKGATPFLPADSEIQDKYELDAKYNTFLLEECGLLNRAFGITLNFSAGPSPKIGPYNDNITAIIKSVSENEEKVKLSVFPLTEAGAQLFQVIEYIPNIDYFIFYLKMLQGQIAKCTVEAYKITSKTDNHLYWDNSTNFLN